MVVRKRSDMWHYQNTGVEHILNNPGCALFMDMGLGKTVTTLTAIDWLINVDMEISKVLVIAPIRVAEDTWPNEIKEWEHLKHLRMSVAVGTQKQRLAALRAPADIYVINRENVPWLTAHYGIAFPFDMVVIDELSSFKSPSSVRFKELKVVRPKVRRVVGLTGTPMPNGLPDLWSQLFLIDRGERLGKTVTAYREAYLVPNKRNNAQVFSYKVANEEAEQEIYDKISDICLSMKKEDYLELPPRLDVTTMVTLSEDNMKRYFEFEKDQVLEMYGSGQEITAVNAASLVGKLLQYANGAIYDETGAWHTVHNDKLDALEDLIEAANGKPVLVFYQFKHDWARIEERFKKLKPIKLKDKEDIKNWNLGKIPMLCAHPASAGHGLNLQHGSNLVAWFSCPHSLELYQQGCTRVDRQGQKESVVNTRIVARGTWDEKVLENLSMKGDRQDRLLVATKALISKYLTA